MRQVFFPKFESTAPLLSYSSSELSNKPLSEWNFLERPVLTPGSSSRRDPTLISSSGHEPMPGSSLRRLKSIQTTVRTLQLDHTKSSLGFISWVVGATLLIVIPVLKLIFVRADSDLPVRQLVFQPIVVAVGVSRSLISFVFLSRAIKKHGIKGFLFLDTVAEEVAQIRRDYDLVIERGSDLLIKLFVPAFILYLLQLVWLYSEVDLKPLPLHLHNDIADMAIIVIAATLSWIYQTTTYLYACVLFWKVCSLQELKMKQYYDMLGQGLDAEYYVLEYDRIIRDLYQTSQRFRHFLAFTGVISVSGALIAMYEVIDSYTAGVTLCMWGELIVLTLVNLTGAWLCLASASRIAHLHRRIVKKSSLMHAKTTLQTFVPSVPHHSGDNENPPVLDKLEAYCQRHEAWARRDALVHFLSSNQVGISVYGFVLDRFFVHTSIGALLTTTWFILGRSLQG